MAVVHATRRAWIAWAAVCVIWGTTYLAIKVALDAIPPFLMGGLRYTSAGLIMAAVLAASGRRLPPVSHWPKIALLGLLMLAVGNGGVVWGEQYLTSGLTAVILATSAFWMVAIDALLPHGDRLHRRQGVGLVVGFSGVVLLVWPEIFVGGIGARHFAIGVASLQIACIGWGIASAYTRRHVLKDDVLGSAALQMVFGGAALCVVAWLTGEWHAIPWTIHAAGALAYLTLAGAVIAFAAYSYALNHMDVATLSLYTYVNPVIAVALGIALLHEPFALRQLLAGVVILAGMAIVKSLPPPPAGESIS